MSADVTAGTAGFCGAELLPHATGPDGSLRPIICTQQPHEPGTWHANGELGTRWAPKLSIGGSTA